MSLTDRTVVPRHPAGWSPPILDVVGREVADEAVRAGRPLRILDPFAGSGLARLAAACGDYAASVVGVELEAEWAAADPRVYVGDATNLPASWAAQFDLVASSPAYGTRMADHHDARDLCKKCDGSGQSAAGTVCKMCKGERLSRRNTYKHALGRDPSPNSSAVLAWGSEYRQFHAAAIRELLRVTVPDGLVVWNVSNHIRGGEEQLVAEWHLRLWLDHGCRLHRTVPVATRRLKVGANRDLRATTEHVLVLRTPLRPDPQLL